MLCKILGLLLVGLTAESATITATSSQASYKAGDSVAVNIALSNVSDLYAFQFDLSFNPAILSAQSISETGYFLSNGVSFSPGLIDNTAGRIRFIGDALSGNAPTFNGSTTLLSVMFAAVSSGMTNIVPTNIILLDSQLSDISTGVTAATVQVTGVPEPSSYGTAALGLVVFLWVCFLARLERAQ